MRARICLTNVINFRSSFSELNMSSQLKSVVTLLIAFPPPADNFILRSTIFVEDTTGYYCRSFKLGTVALTLRQMAILQSIRSLETYHIARFTLLNIIHLHLTQVADSIK